MKISECFDAYIDGYLNEEAVDPSRSIQCMKHLVPEFGDITPESVRSISTKEYAEKRRDQGAAVGTVQREVGVLIASVKWCYERGMISTMPVIGRISGFKARKRVLNQDEAKALLDACKGISHLEMFVTLAMLTGQRKSAILELTWDQVDFQNGLIDFEKRTDPLLGRRKKRAFIPMPAALHSYLYEANRQRILDGKGHSPYVVENSGHRVYSIDRAFRSAVVRAGISEEKGKVTPHVLRHTVATQLVRQGVSLHSVSRFLGHSSVVITERSYITDSPEMLRDAAGALSL
jgi:integrase